MSKTLSVSTILCASFLSINAAAEVVDHSNHEHHSHSGHDHSVGYSKAHFHSEGEFMLGYKYMGMLMKGMKDGDSDITASQVTDAGGQYQYLVSPTRMTMEMHMLEAMYGITDDVNLMVMARYIDKNMDMVNRAGVALKSNSKGVGDTDVTAMVKLSEDESSLLYVNAGLSLPTGNTDYKAVRMGSFGNLPYAMQLGSGTYDPIFGISYSVQEDGFSWGANADAKLRFGLNDEGYRLGDEFKLSAWGAAELTDYAAISLGIEGKSIGGISGEDQGVAGLSASVSTADTDNYGGESVNLSAGLNLYGGSGALEGHAFSVEYELPIYQNLNGPQLSVHHSVSANWSVSF